MNLEDQRTLRALLDDYLRMYASRDDRLTEHFSDDFSGYTGGGDFLVKDRAAWVAITRQDFAQVPRPLRLEVKDVSLQLLAESVAVATSFFTIHLPLKDEVLSRETARLVLVFRKESGDWKIAHSGISIPYQGVREGEVYPLKELEIRNRALEVIVEDRTRQLRESEELHRSILDASPDDITITDLTGRVLWVSSNAVTMFGYDTKEEADGLRVVDFLVPEDRERAMSRVALLLQGGAAVSGPNEYRGLRKDGSTFDIEVNSALLRDSCGTPIRLVLIARDITARKQTEAALKQAVAQIKTLHGLLPICMHCKKIRDDRGQWSPVEEYVHQRTDAQFSHGLCPQCAAKHYPELGPDFDGKE